MDNQEQLHQIEKLYHRLQNESHDRVDFNIAAKIWIKKYAQIWRSIQKIEEEGL